MMPVLVMARGTVELFGKSVEKEMIGVTASHMPVGNGYAISFARDHAICELIERSSCFVVHFLPRGMEETVEQCLGHSGKFVDTFAIASLNKEEAETVDCPKIKGSSGFMECELQNIVAQENHYLFIGKVLKKAMSTTELVVKR